MSELNNFRQNQHTGWLLKNNLIKTKHYSSQAFTYIIVDQIRALGLTCLQQDSMGLNGKLSDSVPIQLILFSSLHVSRNSTDANKSQTTTKAANILEVLTLGRLYSLLWPCMVSHMTIYYDNSLCIFPFDRWMTKWKLFGWTLIKQGNVATTWRLLLTHSGEM